MTDDTGEFALRAAETPADIAACWPLIQLLRPRLTSAALWTDAAGAQRADGYRLWVLWDGSAPVALAGWRVMRNLVHGRHLYVDDLVARADLRGRRLGARLLTALRAEGAALGCRMLVLDSGADNLAAHRFYRREGLRDTALRFTAALDAPPSSSTR